MKRLLIALAAGTLFASPLAAQDHPAGHEKAPPEKHAMMSMAKDGDGKDDDGKCCKMKCCTKGEDGKMSCSMMAKKDAPAEAKPSDHGGKDGH